LYYYLKNKRAKSIHAGEIRGKRINELTNMVRHNYFQNLLFAGYGCGGEAGRKLI